MLDAGGRIANFAMKLRSEQTPDPGLQLKL